MEDEVWKDVKGYEGLYVVSSMGRIASRHFGKLKILKLATSKGYFSCTLFANGNGKQVYVHRTVAIAFLQRIENKPSINHINGIKKDNRSDNLEWCTQQENVIHAFKNNLSKMPNNNKLVVNLTTGIFYDSLREAAKSINMNHKHLSARLVGRVKNKTNFIYV